MSSLYPIASEVTRRIKERFSNIPMIWGGIHPTSDPENCIKEVDYLCVGEGELAAVDLCNALHEGRDTRHSPTFGQEKEKRFFPMVHVHCCKILIGCRIPMYVMRTSTTLRGVSIPLKSHGRERLNIESTFHEDVRITVRIAMFPFCVMSITRKGASFIVLAR